MQIKTVSGLLERPVKSSLTNLENMGTGAQPMNRQGGDFKGEGTDPLIQNKIFFVSSNVRFNSREKSSQRETTNALKNFAINIISMLPGFLQNMVIAILNHIVPGWLPTENTNACNNSTDSTQTVESNSKSGKIICETDEKQDEEVAGSKNTVEEKEHVQLENNRKINKKSTVYEDFKNTRQEKTQQNELKTSSVKPEIQTLPKEPVEITSEAGLFIEEIMAKKLFSNACHGNNLTGLPSKRKDGSIITTGSFRYFRFNKEKFEAIEIPYGNGHLGMIIILPYENTKISDLRLGMTPEKLKQWIKEDLDDQKIGSVKSRVKLPCLASASTNKPLGELLKEIGINNFQEPKNTLASNFVQQENIKNPKIVMDINRPFLFILRDNQSKKALCHGVIKDLKNISD